MTICIAALANEAIVCVADKMLTFGDYAQWDSDVTKIIPVGNTHSLIAGSMTHCQSVIQALEIEIANNPYKYDTDLAILLEKVYKEQYSKGQDTSILHARGVTRALYENSVASSQMSEGMKIVFNEMGEYDFDCDLMVCGFDQLKSAYIISIAPPGLI